MQLSTYEKVKAVLLEKGFKFFEGANYNLNLIGVRNTFDQDANTFNDLFLVAFRVNGHAQLLQFACTTDPGTYYRENPANVKGTGILPLGQHLGLWKLGLHKNQYPALVQANPVALIRDNNQDAHLDLDAPLAAPEMAGINCHHGADNGVSKIVGKWSAGCQVLASAAHHAQLIGLANKAASIYGDGFSYTLIEDKDLA